MQFQFQFNLFLNSSISHEKKKALKDFNWICVSDYECVACAQMLNALVNLLNK